jgi:hypothetical protein
MSIQTTSSVVCFVLTLSCLLQISVYSIQDDRYTHSFVPKSAIEGPGTVQDFGFSGDPCKLIFILMDAPACSLIAYQWQSSEPLAILQDTSLISAAFNALDDTALLALEKHQILHLTYHARKKSYMRTVVHKQTVCS